ncbi:MAG: hypothetical protein V1725_05980 [archaeon]
MEFIDSVVGIIFLPLGVLLFLYVFGIYKSASLLGIPLLLLGAVGLILIQVANIASSHAVGEHVVLSYFLHTPMIFPSVLYGLVLVGVVLPVGIITALPIIMASFIFVEGMYSFFI